MLLPRTAIRAEHLSPRALLAVGRLLATTKRIICTSSGSNEKGFHAIWQTSRSVFMMSASF
jgi:hypothetical protein